MATPRRIRADLRALIDPAHVIDDPAVISRVARDTWVISGLAKSTECRGRHRPPAWSVRPDTAEVSAILKVRVARARQRRTLRGGLGCVRAVLAPERSLVVDLGAMRALKHVDDVVAAGDGRAGTPRVGVRGGTQSSRATRWGISAVDRAFVGGWLGRDACRGSVLDQVREHRGHVGRLRSGAPERRDRTDARRAARRRWPDLRHLFLGAEGTTGILTELTYAIHPLAPGDAEASDRLSQHASGSRSAASDHARRMATGRAPPLR